MVKYSVTDKTTKYAVTEQFEKFGPQKVLADFATKLRYEDLPKDVVLQAKKILLHTIGVSLSGYQLKLGKTYLDLAKMMGTGKKEATIIGDGSKVSVLQAAFANGILADMMDWEDIQMHFGDGHGSAIVIPTALAMGEYINASGKEVLTAIVAAWEVMVRLEQASTGSESFLEKTFVWSGMPCSEFKSFAAAIAAGRLLKINFDQMVTAIGIAGLYSHPIVNSSGCATKAEAYHGIYGWTNLAGVFAAFHAQRGITGYETLLEGRKGYWRMIGMDSCDTDIMTVGLGKDYYIMENEFKHWPAECGIQNILDGVDILMKKHGIKGQDVKEVHVTNAMPFDVPDYYPEVRKPESLIDAQFSLPYTIALLLSGEKVGAGWYTEEKFNDPKIKELMGKVKIEKLFDVVECWKLNKQQFSWMTTTITISTKDGKRYSETVTEPKGHPKNPLTLDEHKALFRTAASDTIGEPKIGRIIKMIDELEKVDDISELVGLLH